MENSDAEVYNERTKGGTTMEPIYMRQAETQSIMGDKIVLYYFTHEGKSNSKDRVNIRYGVGIDMYTQLPEERTLRERKIVEDIFSKKSDAEKFIDVLCRGYVTPATLEDIINDNIIPEKTKTS